MDDKRQLPESTSWLEWAVAGIGAAFIAATLGYLIYFGVTYPSGPPDIIITPTSYRALSDGHLVEFTAQNNGNSTAANLVVKGALMDGGEVVEESEMTLDYLPQKAERTGGLIFENDPSEYQVKLQATGYSAP
ncbi:TIGR02588 family protein [Halodurantibacterium flavum]|uniref:TIGR02588 family protein n=1 Tax=Halodurantibacterium flavum TaxID=1382802 RepID=A0ABW4S868_9RHOB